MKNIWFQKFILTCAAALSACGGGSGSGSGGGAACQNISGGTSQVASTGPVSNASAAADGNLYSFASLSASTQTASIRATAQNGIVFPAGSHAGAFMTFKNQGSASITTIWTYLNGAPVENSNSNPMNIIFEPAKGGTDAEFYFGFVTSSPFNAVEFMETDNGSSGSPDYRVYEICSDGHS